MFFYDGLDIAKKTCVFTLLLTQAMVIQAQPAGATDPATGAQGQEAAADSGRSQPRSYYFPRWPEKRSAPRERVPPPPPGPYMSSALTGNSLDTPSFFEPKKPEVKFESSSAPVATFSPDTPWPSTSESPQRWEPENGYNYVKPQAIQQRYPVRSPYYNYGYPVMNWSGANPGAKPVGSYR